METVQFVLLCAYVINSLVWSPDFDSHVVSSKRSQMFASSSLEEKASLQATLFVEIKFSEEFPTYECMSYVRTEIGVWNYKSPQHILNFE
jgi:hypothetical protein